MNAATTSAVTVAPSTPAIGAELGGLDLREPLTDELRAELTHLLLRHKVLFFRDQQLDTAAQVAFARNFGRVLVFPTVMQQHPEHPGVHLIVPRPQPPRPDGGRRNGHWHIDASGLINPPIISVLRAIDIPEVGGDTIWASGAAAYAGLPDELRQTVDELHVTHDLTRHFRERGVEYPLISRKLVRTHPETGEKVLTINFLEDPKIVGLAPEESDRLIARISDELTQPEYQVRFRWSPGAVAVWDNRAVIHYAVRDYGDFPRYMERVMVADFHQPTVEQLT